MIEWTMTHKPLSVNECWQGKRFKTKAYTAYENALLYTLPNLVLPPPPFEVNYTFGFSSIAADIDNPIKPLQDILCKKYQFDDKLIQKITVEKVSTKRGQEFFKFSISTYIK